MSNLHNKNTYSASQMALCLLSVFALYMLATSPAYAQVVNVCTFYNNLVQNSIAKGASTLAVVALALGAMFGKVTWGMAILVAVGISGLFGAAGLAAMAGGGCP